MEDLVFVDSGESSEETFKVKAHVTDFHVTKVFSEVSVLEVGQDRNDLVLVSKGCDEWAD
jgi:hypothetical protein